MGNAESKISSSLHIVRVTAGSIACTKSILPIFQYVVSIDDVPIRSEMDITRLVEAWSSTDITLGIYDSRTKEVERVCIDKRKGEESLGFGVRLHTGEMQPVTFKVLDLEYNSAALRAGLIKDQDYIIGHLDGAFDSEDDLERLLFKHVEKELVLLVYNIGMSSIRKVAVSISRDQEELLGCELGTGIINEVPYIPGSVEIEDELAAGIAPSATVAQVEEHGSVVNLTVVDNVLSEQEALAPKEDASLGGEVEDSALPPSNGRARPEHSGNSAGTAAAEEEKGEGGGNLNMKPLSEEVELMCRETGPGQATKDREGVEEALSGTEVEAAAEIEKNAGQDLRENKQGLAEEQNEREKEEAIDASSHIKGDVYLACDVSSLFTGENYKAFCLNGEEKAHREETFQTDYSERLPEQNFFE